MADTQDQNTGEQPQPIEKKAEPKSQQRQTYSRPVFIQRLELNSLQAQKVMNRSFERVANALYSLDVILRIIGDPDEVNRVDDEINALLDRVSEDMGKTMEQLKKLMDDNGIEAMPGYSAPEFYQAEITSPQAAQFLALLRKLDELVSLLDTLWLNNILTSKQRSDATFEWQQRLIKLAGKVIGWEKRARTAAHSKGKDDEVNQNAPEKTSNDEELEQGSDTDEPAVANG